MATGYHEARGSKWPMGHLTGAPYAALRGAAGTLPGTEVAVLTGELGLRAYSRELVRLGQSEGDNPLEAPVHMLSGRRVVHSSRRISRGSEVETDKTPPKVYGSGNGR